MAFRELGDIRGTYKLLPNYVQGSRKKNECEEIEFWHRRLCIHFRLNYNHFCSDICYDRSKNKPSRTSPKQNPLGAKVSQDEQYKRDAFIAMWHYHPHILQKYFSSEIRLSRKNTTSLPPRTINLQQLEIDFA